MGGAKQWAMKHDADVQWAVQRLVESGYGSECEIHDGVFLSNYNDGALEEAVADAEIVCGSRGLQATELNALFDEASQMFGVECYSCQKNAHDN